MRAAPLLFVILCPLGSTQSIRQDSPSLCSTPVEKLLNPTEILTHGYFWDASVVLTRVLQKSVSYEELKTIALKQAKNLGHQSVSICAEPSPFIVSYPSKSPVQKDNSGKLTIPLAELKAECDPVEFLWASQTEIANIPLQEVLDLKALGSGSLGISCAAKNSANQGPELRYLIGEQWSLPASVFPKDHRYESVEDARSWVSALRKTCKTPELTLRALEPKLEQGIQNETQHDMVWLEQVSKFYNHGVLSEERSQGRNLREALSLLWISPFHRRGLLNCEASSVAVTLRKVERGIFLHFLFFKS